MAGTLGIFTSLPKHYSGMPLATCNRLSAGGVGFDTAGAFSKSSAFLVLPYSVTVTLWKL